MVDLTLDLPPLQNVLLGVFNSEQDDRLSLISTESVRSVSYLVFCTIVLVFQHLQCRVLLIYSCRPAASIPCIPSSSAKNVMLFGATAVCQLKSVLITVQTVFLRFLARAYAQRRTGKFLNVTTLYSKIDAPLD